MTFEPRPPDLAKRQMSPRRQAPHLVVIDGGDPAAAAQKKARRDHRRLRFTCLTASMLLHGAAALVCFLMLSSPYGAGPSGSWREAGYGAGALSVELIAADGSELGRQYNTPNAAQSPAEEVVAVASIVEDVSSEAVLEEDAHDNAAGGFAIGPRGSTSVFAPAAGGGADYRSQLLAHIERYKRYPDAARRAGERGVARLLFMISREGRVLDVRVEQSSGYPDLDREAVETLLRSQPLPSVPEGLPDPLRLQLPVEFSIQ